MTSSQTLAAAFADICVMDAPLNERLAAYAAKLRELNFPFAEAYDQLVARLYAGEVGSSAPKAGELLPGFLLPDRSGSLISLDDLVSDSLLVLNFNRGHWCPFCKISLKTIADYHLQIERAGARIVSIMPDRQQFASSIGKLTDEQVLILSDIDNGYALSMGLVMWVGEKVKTLMKGRGYHLDVFHGNDGWFLPVPATFVVEKDRRIRARFVDPDFRRRMEIDNIVAALENSPSGAG